MAAADGMVISFSRIGFALALTVAAQLYLSPLENKRALARCWLGRATMTAPRNAEDIVLAFVEAWNALDDDRIYPLLAEDVFYHNMPMKPVIGREAVRRHMAAWPVDTCAWEVIHIASNGNVVLTERIDRFTRGADRIVVPVMGTFEIAGGLITKWRDYFDMAALKPQILA